MAEKEEKLKVKEEKARAKAAKAEEKAKKKQAKARAKASPAISGLPPIVVIPHAEKKPWWKKFLQEHLIQLIVKVIAGLIVAFLVWWFGIRR